MTMEIDFICYGPAMLAYFYYLLLKKGKENVYENTVNDKNHHYRVYRCDSSLQSISGYTWNHPKPTDRPTEREKEKND